MLTILFDGVAYGMLLFVLAVGLCVTLGLMNFINLAHGAFAMAGGYLAVVLMNRQGISFYWCLPAAFVFSAVLGVVLERVLYRRLYDKTHLDQVLFSIGLIFMAMATVDYFMGASQQIINLPPSLNGRVEILGANVGVYRLFVIAICGVLTVALQYVIAKTRFGSRLRASVDDGRVARGMGIDVTGIFALT
ncbi:MAG TPA: branched-chain amino acid ABC transporter permease, partial [Beijerinckiaceae bacterium]